MGLISDRVAKFESNLREHFGACPAGEMAAEIKRMTDNAVKLDQRLMAEKTPDIRSLCAAFMVRLDRIEASVGIVPERHIVVTH